MATPTAAKACIILTALLSFAVVLAVPSARPASRSPWGPSIEASGPGRWRRTILQADGEVNKTLVAQQCTKQRAAAGPGAAAGDFVHAEGQLHGFLRKRGVTAVANWHPIFAPLRKAQWNAWLAQKGSLLADPASPGALVGAKPPFILPFHAGRGCNIYYNERYKVIFVRTQKAGSTTTMAFFGECSTEPDRPSCLRPLEVEDALQLQLMWRNYFVFGWTRNPWLRAVSSYHFLLHAVVDQPHCARITWDTFCRDPLVFGDLCRAHRDCCPHFNHNFMQFGVNDQTTCLTTDSGAWAVDFIGRMEHFDADFALVVDEINRRLPPGVQPLQSQESPKVKNTNQVPCSDEEPAQPPKEPGPAAVQAEVGAGGEGAGGAATSTAATAASSSPAAGGNNSGARRLHYGQLPGFLFAPENYCDKSKFYTGRHAACFHQVARFYGNDIRRLGFSSAQPAVLGGQEGPGCSGDTE